MISYAPPGGSVGPHLDLYDVFILQAKGHRRWQISTQPVAADNQVAGTPLRIQKDFQAEHEWLLEPGDLIYLPPGVSHFGVATDDCMSYSIGFRATSHADLLNDFIGFVTQDLDQQRVYRDSDLKPQQHSNEITMDALDRVRNIFRQYLDADHPQLLVWLGHYMSDPKTDVLREIDQPASHCSELPERLYRHPASRFAFYRMPDHALLFVDGEEHKTGIDFSQTLCKSRAVKSSEILAISNQDEQQLLLSLFNTAKLVASLDD
jgi:50S ribosomal protein L16 3-hydroxylase